MRISFNLQNVPESKIYWTPTDLKRFVLDNKTFLEILYSYSFLKLL